MSSINNLEYDQNLADPLIGAIALTATSTRHLLNELLQNADQQTMVFDLDSTLLDNRPRNAIIMSEFGELKKEPLLGNAAAEHFLDWSPQNAMAAIGLPGDTIDRLIEAYRPFWSERFFTSEYCRYDISVSGAAEFVAAVKERGGTICYLTGRHEGMRAGTQGSLQNLGFPTPGSKGVELLMKPEKTLSDDLFKVEALKKLGTFGPVCAAFDNEPTHINSYRTAFPDATCVHLLTDHSMREVKLLTGVTSILNFVR